MSYKRRQETGFTIVEVMLLFIIVLIIGFIGYYVYTVHNKTIDTYDAASNSSTSRPSVSTKQAAAQKYLTIKEYGVKLPLSNDLNDAYYKVTSDNTGIYLSLDKYRGTDCAADQVSLGAISRFLATDKDDNGDTMLADFPQAIKVGDWYYRYEHPNAGCNGTSAEDTVDTAAMAKTAALMNQFGDAAAKLTAAN